MTLTKTTLLVVFGLLLFLQSSVFAQTEEILQEPAEPETELLSSDIIPSAETPLPLEQIKTFAEIFTRIKRSYVDQVTDEQLLDDAVQGMLNGLDPHSVYLKEEAYANLNEGTTGRFGGLGLEVMMEDGFLKVIAPIDDTPASEAGITTGDVIIKIDGKIVSGQSLREATDQMRGEPGTSLTITVLRESTDEPFDLTLTRAVVRLKSVKHKKLSDQIGYLRVSQFQTGTAETFRKQLKILRQNPQFAGLILDLRNNPGGLINSAVAIADLFIQEGDIVYTKGRLGQSEQRFSATPGDTVSGLPVVVLINGGSASASEIVAGALQDHKRALILGTSSFGKGSVQTVVNLTDTAALKLTTARYYTPNGRSIQAEGIYPDVVVEQKEFKTKTQIYKGLKENELPGHLQNKNKKAATRQLSQEAVLKSVLEGDYQLREAYNLIKGLVLYQVVTDKNQKSDK